MKSLAEAEGTAMETSLSIYQSTWRNIPEDFKLQQHRCEKQKHRTSIPVTFMTMQGPTQITVTPV